VKCASFACSRKTRRLKLSLIFRIDEEKRWLKKTLRSLESRLLVSMGKSCRFIRRRRSRSAGGNIILMAILKLILSFCSSRHTNIGLLMMKCYWLTSKSIVDLKIHSKLIVFQSPVQETFQIKSQILTILTITVSQLWLLLTKITNPKSHGLSTTASSIVKIVSSTKSSPMQPGTRTTI
jgi:hypothetical protein